MESREWTDACDWFQYEKEVIIERYSITPDTPDNYLWELAVLIEEKENAEWKENTHNGEGELMLDGTFNFLQSLRDELQEEEEEEEEA